MSTTTRRGRIITFYSYKGGTGRSMALANVAWILASQGRAVLTIDWDLEAPGLFRYFRPFLLDKDLHDSDGIIDFATEFTDAALTPTTDSDPHWYLPYADLLQYARSLNYQFPRGGQIDFIPAGRQTSAYAKRVNSFDWQAFFERAGGGTLLEETRRLLRREYDYILIDSRTGVSDTSGITTVHLPDDVVICFTLNNQGIEGASAVADSIAAQRTAEPVRIFPVPMRTDNAELEKLEARMTLAAKRFGAYPLHFEATARASYLRSVGFRYVPYFAYEEILAPFREDPKDPNSLLAAALTLTKALMDVDAISFESLPDEVKSELRAQYATASETAESPDLVLLHSSADAAWAAKLTRDLEKETWRGRPLRVFLPQRDVHAGEEFLGAMKSAMQKSRFVGSVLGSGSESLPGAEPLGSLVPELIGRQRWLPLLIEGGEVPVEWRSVTPLDFAGQPEQAFLQIRARLREEQPTHTPALPPLAPGSPPRLKTARPIPPIEEARTALRLGNGETGELIALAKKLKAGRAFGDARRIFSLALQRLPASASPEKRCYLVQQQALMTSKNPDLPIALRHDEALDLLATEIDLETTRDQESLGIAGGICKRKWEHTGVKQDLERSFALYQRGAREGAAGDTGYTAINAAFTLDLLATLDTAPESARRSREEARAIRRSLISELKALPSREPARNFNGDWWYLVTLAEAHFGVREYDEAARCLQAARNVEEIAEWEYETTARQLAALARVQDPELLNRPQLEQSPPWRALAALLGEEIDAIRTAFLGKVGLALSGGGFRASLFHIGVLARLADLDLLRRVEVLSCVSGGSVIGAHYYLEVRKLLRDKSDQEITCEDYREIVRRVSTAFVEGVQRNLRARVFGSLRAHLKRILFPHYSRTQHLGELIEKLIYAGVSDGEGDRPRWLNESIIKPKGEPGDFQPKHDNWRRSAKAPILILNATTLNTGHTWQYTSTWMGEPPSWLDADIDANGRLRRLYYRDAPEPHDRVRLGHAVAASCCVPGLFEPLELAGLYPGHTVQLVDGGVHNNQGTTALIEQNCDVLFVSDASGQMNTDSTPTTGRLDVLMRTNDILMARVREAEARDVLARRATGRVRQLLFLHLKRGLSAAAVPWVGSTEPAEIPASTPATTQYGIRKDVQERLAALRTDLDSFSEVEAFALMTSGYRMAESELAGAIKGFPVPPVSLDKWDFLAIDFTLRSQNVGDEKLSTVLQHLEVGASKAFKTWKLSPGLRSFTLAIGVVLAALAFVLMWADTSIGFGWLLIVILGLPALVGAFAAGAAVIGMVLAILKYVLRAGRLDEPLRRAIFGLLSLPLVFLLKLHLWTLDPYFRHLGRFDMATARRTGRTTIAIVCATVIGLQSVAGYYFRADKYQITAAITDAAPSVVLQRRDIGLDRVAEWIRVLNLKPPYSRHAEAARQALSEATAQWQNSEKIRALVALAVSAISPTERKAALEQAKTLAMAIPDPGKRAAFLSLVAHAHLPDPESSELLEIADEAADLVLDKAEAAWVFIEIAKAGNLNETNFPSARTQKATESIKEIKEPENRVLAQIACAELGATSSPPEIWAAVSADIGAVKDDAVYAWLLARVAEFLVRYQNGQAVWDFIFSKGVLRHAVEKAAAWPPPLAPIMAEAFARTGDLKGGVQIAEQIAGKSEASPERLNYQVEAFFRVANAFSEKPMHRREAIANYDKAAELAQKLPSSRDRSRQIAAIGAALAGIGELRHARQLAKDYCEDPADRLQVYTAIVAH